MTTEALRASHRRRSIAWHAALATVFAASCLVFMILFWAFGGELYFNDTWLYVAVVGLVIAGYYGFRRRWLRALTLAVLPLSFLIEDPLLWSSAMKVGETVRFYRLRDYYLAEIPPSPEDGTSRLVAFRFSTEGWLRRVNYHLLVFDETDEVMLPPDRRSAVWNDRFAQLYAAQICVEAVKYSALGDHFYEVAALGDHFYFVRCGLPIP
jgi:hypothetical protein